MLKIIGGRFKGRKIATMPGNHTRPTKAQTRELVFNCLQNRYYLEDFTGYDLFAGSGALGIEALSRGVPEVFFLFSR